MKVGSIQEVSIKKETPFRAGDLVNSDDLGNGVVVGFSSISGEPHVFFYSQQIVLCIGDSNLRRM